MVKKKPRILPANIWCQYLLNWMGKVAKTGGTRGGLSLGSTDTPAPEEG